MVKSLVKPSTSVEYICPASDQHIKSHRPSVVEPTDWINSLLAGGKLKLVKEDVGNLTDAKFNEVWLKNDGDLNKTLAVLFPAKTEPAKTEPAKTDSK